MLDLTSPFTLWPIGIALGGLLVFEVARRSLRVDPPSHHVEARSRAIRPEWRAANAPLRPTRAPWPSRPMEAQPIFAGNARGRSIPSANDNRTRCEATVMVKIRVISEDDDVVLATGHSKFELDGMTLATPSTPGLATVSRS